VGKGFRFKGGYSSERNSNGMERSKKIREKAVARHRKAQEGKLSERAREPEMH